MGMYTGLRFKGIIKNEYREDVKKAITDIEGAWGNCEHEELKKFDKVDRSFCIPFGGLSYMPDCWEESENENATNGFGRYFNETTGLLCFQCSLKNYEDTIEYFIEKVIPVICEKLIHCEVLYEEWEVSELYEFKEGIVTQLDYGIRYSQEENLFSYGGIQSDKKDKNILYENFDFTTESKYR